jgi:hypothetical protein
LIDSALPAALVIAALALALGFMPRALATGALVLAFAALLTAGVTAMPTIAPTVAVLVCWVAVGVLAIATWLPPCRSPAVVIAGSIAAGLVAGVALRPVDPTSAFGYTLIAAVLILPSSLVVGRGYAVAPRVVASWLFAVAVLAALLPYVVPHPGYVPDHRE